MYTLQTITEPSTEPVTDAELKASLRLNTTSEDALLPDFITTARVTFETVTRRPVLPTVYRQWFERFTEPVYLVRGGVTAVASVHYYDQTDTLVTLDPMLWDSDLTGLVPSVFVPTNYYPATSTKKVPVGYVQFTAGWADAASVPRPVKVAIKLLAAHLFKHRHAYDAQTVAELPMGFRAVCDQYRTGMISQMGRDGEGHGPQHLFNPWRNGWEYR